MSASRPAPTLPPTSSEAVRLPTALVVLVWVAPVGAVAALVAATLVPYEDLFGEPWILPLFAAVTGSCGIVGAFLATRLPRNAVGWILWGFAIATASGMAAQAWVAASVTLAAGALPGTLLAAWWAGVPISPALATVLLFLPVLFPDGRPPSRRWRPVLVLFGLAVAVVAFPPLFRAGPLAGLDGLPPIENPFGLPGIEPLVDVASSLGDAIAPLALPLAISAAVVRYRRGTRVERQQLRWFGSAAALAAAGLIAAVLLPEPYGVVGWVLCVSALGIVPVAIAVAILRYRLYEIDRIVSRTLSYAAVTALLALVFVASNLALQAVLSDATGGGTLGVAASTLAVAALFQPLRRRVQAPIDRRFNRARADAERVVTAFASHTRGEVDLVELRRSVMAAAVGSVAPAGIALWLRGARGPDR